MDVNLNKGSTFKPNSYKNNSSARYNAANNAKANAAYNSAVNDKTNLEVSNPAATVELGTKPEKNAGVYGPYTGASQKSQSSELSFEFTYSESTSTTIEATVSKSTGNTKEKMTAANLSQKESITIQKLQEEANKKTEVLRKLVESLLSKQGSKVPGFETKPVIELTDDDMIAALKSGKLDIDPETATQAASDISEDGYWGVKQTSERLVSFAMNLSGNNVKYADSMIEAIKRGYQDAESKWGGELPDLCKKTLEAAIKQLEDWRDSAKNTGTASDLKVEVSYSESSSIAVSSSTKIEA